MITNPNDLPPKLSLPGTTSGHYLLPDEAKNALRLARVRPRPLLVIGEAGVGKSQLAVALAHHWRVPFLKFVVQSTTQADELLWRFDAVQRLAEAQVMAATGLKQHQVASALDSKRYLHPGVLWWAMNWESASNHIKQHECQLAQVPKRPPRWAPGHGCVVLIDEIDKATADLPNNLLDVLDSGSFALPSGENVPPAIGGQPPLIVITSNGDRDLPTPFLRRCYVLNLTFPTADAEAWLIQRAKAHFGNTLHKDVWSFAAAQLLRDRLSTSNTQYKPGVSEYLDLLYAVKGLSGDKKTQMQWVADLGKFVLKRQNTT